MNNYTIRFSGKKIGSIGKFCKFEVQVQAENEEQAVLGLYKNYEHIQWYLIKLTSEK